MEKSESPVANTITVMPNPAHIPVEFSRLEQGGAVGAVLTFAAGVLWWRKGWSKTSKEVGEDKAEGSFLTRLMTKYETAVVDRDTNARALMELAKQHSNALEQLWKERVESASRIATLESQNKFQADQIQELEAEMVQLRAELLSFKNTLRSNGFSPLNPVI